MSQFDLSVFGGYLPNKEYLSAIMLFDDNVNSQACVGIVKLAQRWLIEFLTELGSQPNQPARGCTFLTQFRNGRLQTEAAVDAEFRFSELDILQNLLTDETTTTPLDERLQSVTLDGITILPGNLRLAVTLTSQAGTSRSVSVPIGATPTTRA